MQALWRHYSGLIMLLALGLPVAYGAIVLFGDTSSPPHMRSIVSTPQAPDASSAHSESEAPVRLSYKEIRYTVRRGDTWIALLTKLDIPTAEAYALVDAIKQSHNPRKLNTGHTIALTWEHQGTQPKQLHTVQWQLSPIESVRVTRADANAPWNAQMHTLPVVTTHARAGGIIHHSLYVTLTQSGLPDRLVAELIAAYSYDIDFQREIRQGNRVDVVYESRHTEDGTPVPGGHILYALLHVNGKDHIIYRYENAHGHSDYYTPKGDSVRKALLRTPINGARISSRFGMRRHPVLGYSKMHKGVDFAAPRGTPIYAAGDGVVEYAGRKGSYGKYVRIRHNRTYATAYAHASRIARSIRKGKRVKQGQIIAYVGTTGRSTGPHLHYELLKNGKQVNPRSVTFKTGKTLKGKQLAAFKAHMRTLDAQRAALPSPFTVATTTANE